jgi:3-methyladenine DNA glycosylase AlkC
MGVNNLSINKEGATMPEPFKDTMYDRTFFDDLTTAFRRVYPAFDAASFLTRIYDSQWKNRELKARMRHVTTTLHSVLPDAYRTALDIVRQAALVMTSRSFGLMTFPDFVEVYGLDDWEASIPALEQFTQQASSEYAVRPFIVRDQARMMAQMLRWARHASHHVRRLASEGCRPRLPWGMALPAFQADPSPILPVLEQLKCDESDFVRRSVANNLNDISKDNPQVVIDLLRQWQAHDTAEMREIVNRALRTLVKKGDPTALAMLGYAGSALYTVKNLTVEPETIPMGGELTISFTVASSSETPQSLLIDYVVHLVRANGQLTPKVFKLTKKVLAPGETVTITKKHSFRPVTTRKYYPGEHAVEIQVNGTLFERRRFVLTA